MKGFDVLKIKSAVKARNKFDLSRTHLSTMDFGQIIPLFAEETVPGDKFSVDGEYFARLAPLVKPTYGKVDFRTVAAFVPYHQIAVDAEAWLAGKTTMEGQTTKHRYFTLETFHSFLYGYCVSAGAGTSASTVYTFTNAGGAVTYCDYLSAAGKYYVKILNALGYSLPQNVDLQTSSSWYQNHRNDKLSAYPLLAFFKLYNDYMSQSQRFNSSQLSDVLYKVKNGIADASIWNASSGSISAVGLRRMFDNLYLNYDNDYFTSAWQTPNNAINSIESVNSMTVPSNTPVQSSVNNNFTSLNVVGGAVTLSQRTLDFLKNFDDWVRRNNYSGSRAVQQIYSRFGIKPDDFKAHYAHVITTDNMSIQIGDITATAGFTNANSQDIPLGDYAGKGILSGNKGFSIDVDDFGMLFVFGYFTIVPMNAFGYDRRVLRTTPLDYYNPEFDGMGADAISYGEVFNNSSIIDTYDDSTVFGFTERYNAYRYGRDVITGEFRDLNPYSGEMNVWHTGRNLTNVRSSGNLVAQSSAVNTLPQANSEYNRIFADANPDEDHFYVTARFNVSAIRPMLNLNQVPKLGEGDTAVPRNGNVIS